MEVLYDSDKPLLFIIPKLVPTGVKFAYLTFYWLVIINKLTSFLYTKLSVFINAFTKYFLSALERWTCFAKVFITAFLFVIENSRQDRNPSVKRVGLVARVLDSFGHLTIPYDWRLNYHLLVCMFGTYYGSITAPQHVLSSSPETISSNYVSVSVWYLIIYWNKWIRCKLVFHVVFYMLLIYISLKSSGNGFV